MAAPPREPADEARHPPGPEPDWCEWWRCELADDDRAVSSRIELVLRPHLARAEFQLSLVRHGHPLVVVVVDDAPLPRWPHLELRASGLWVELACLIPFEHFTVQLEAFGLEVDDPADRVGRRVPLGFDLEWESDPGGSLADCAVHGEILVGDDQIDVDGRGARAHGWGVPQC